MKKIMLLIFIALALVACGVDTLKPDELTFATLPEVNGQTVVISNATAITVTGSDTPGLAPSFSTNLTGTTGTTVKFVDVTIAELNGFMPGATKLPAAALVTTTITTTVAHFKNGVLNTTDNPTNKVKKVEESQVSLTFNKTKNEVFPTYDAAGTVLTPGIEAEYSLTTDLTYPAVGKIVPATIEVGYTGEQTKTAITVTVSVKYEEAIDADLTSNEIENIANTVPTFAGTIEANGAIKHQISDFDYKGNAYVFPVVKGTYVATYMSYTKKVQTAPVFETPTNLTTLTPPPADPTITNSINIPNIGSIEMTYNGELTIIPSGAEIGTKYKIWAIKRAMK